MIGAALPRWLRVLSRACLRLYPRAFRAENGAAYADAVAHRWVRERGRALRTAAWLILDTVSAAPRAWRQTRGVRRRGRALGWLGGLAADGRIGIRSLARRPGFSALVVVTIGVGVGANTALFAALDRVVLHPLPFVGGDRMMYLAFQDPVSPFP